MAAIRSAIVMAALISGAWAPMVANAAPAAQVASAPQRERINIDKGWRFAYGHADDAEKDMQYGLRPFFFAKAGYGDGPANVDFGDTAWRKIDLPHDWAVELPFDQRGNANHGSKAIGHAFPENSVGWYRKALDIPVTDKGRRISLEFDGVYRNSAVWVNGHYMGTEPSGYSGFGYDITDYINYGGRNVVSVRVDATVEEGWFYEGAGIYRHVWLTKTDPLHVAKWGTFVKTAMDGNVANIDVAVTVTNDSKSNEAFGIRQDVLDGDGKIVATSETLGLTADAVSSRDFSTSLRLERPRLWSLDDPYLYRLRTTIRRGPDIADTYETRFGVRTVTWDADKGFFLNGQSVKLKGTNNHQDHAGVGTAMPDGLQTWRLKQLKSFGVNAYRASHNPPTPELLDDADALGILVIDEHRMMGTTPEIRGQLERMVKRDRNHPSVILWSVGNEEWALEGNELGTHLAIEMQDIVKRMDPTRRTSVAASASGRGTSVGADVIGFNYGAQHDVDGFHAAHPDKPAAMTEEGSTLTTRGVYFDDRAKSHLNAYDRQGRPGNSLSIEEGWRRVQARPWMSGMFIWTGFDYRGETTPFGWPAISSQFGMIDTTGVFKDTAYYLKAVWKTEPSVHILPHWNWQGREGQPIDVRVYSNGDAVELFQDGRSLGRKAMVRDSHLRWDVPYRAGKLTAKSYLNGKMVASTDVATTGEPARVTLTPDKTTLMADGTDVSVVWVNVTDKSGRIVPTANDRVHFETTGPIRILGVGNGDPGSHEADRPAPRDRFFGVTGWRSLAINDLSGNDAWSNSADTSTWRDPTQWLPPEQQPPLTKGLVLRGQFVRPASSAGDIATLFIDQLSTEQNVYVNDTQVTPRMVEGGLVIDLDPAQLKDVNSLTYVTPTPKGGVSAMFDRSVAGTKWGTLRLTTPAGPWQRSVFNGWAQIIIQSTGESGSATLKATSSGLKATSTAFRLQ